VPVSPATGIPDGEELLFELRLGNAVLSPAIPGIKQGTSVLLPLGEIVSAVEFPIAIDPRAGRASGWFIREAQSFALDLDSGMATVAGERKPVPRGAVARDADDLLIDARVLTDWFGIDFSIDLTNLAITLAPRQRLPVQERLDRQNRMAGAVTGQQHQASIMPRRETPYRAADWPMADLSLTSYTVGGPGAKPLTGARYSILGAGDVGYLNSLFFVGGERNQLRPDWIDNARLTLRRQDPDGRLPLGATSAELGEIRTARVPIAGTAGFERGARLTNQPLAPIGRFDRTDIVGEAPPGWDVELYRNGTLSGAQRVGPDGRYLFPDIDLFLGTNEFRIVLYGPQGQVREETRSIPLGLGMTAPGRIDYDLTVSQKNQPFYRRNLVRQPDTGTPRVAATAAYGLSEGLSLSFGGQSMIVEDGRSSLVQAGLMGQAAGVLAGVNAVADNGGGYGYEVIGQTAIGGSNLRLSHQSVADLAIGTASERSDSQRMLATLFGNIDPFGTPVFYGLSAGVQQEAGGSREGIAGLQLGSVIGRTSLFNTIQWSSEDRTGRGGDQVTGTVQANMPIGDVFVRGFARYEAVPQPDLTLAGASARVPFTPTLTGEFGVNSNFVRKGTTATASLDWDAGFARIGPRVDVTDGGVFAAQIEVNFSLAREPRSGSIAMDSQPRATTGGVSVRVFEDKRHDGVFGPEDVPIAGVRVQAPQSQLQGITDERGVAFLPGAPVNAPTDVLVDAATLPDVHQRPADPGVAIVPRAGVVDRIDVPVIRTAEIQGTVYGPDDQGKTVPLRAVRLHLKDGKGETVASQTTAFDGIYYFADVAPGRYTLEIDRLDAERRGLAAPVPQTVAIPDNGGIVELAALNMTGPSASARTPSAPDDPFIRPAIRYVLDLGRYRSQFGRLASLALMRREFPEVLGTTQMVELPGPPRIGETEGEPLYLGPVTDGKAAMTVCRRLQSRNQPCGVLAVAERG
jgi:hypothetical protein